MRLVARDMSPDAVKATLRAIQSAGSEEQLDALQRSLERAYPGDPDASQLLAELAARRRRLTGTE